MGSIKTVLPFLNGYNMAKTNQADGFESMQPCDWYEERLKFPILVQHKIDGVAAYNRHGKLLGRSLKQHGNRFVTKQYSLLEYHGFCGELIVGNDKTASDLCRMTTSAVSTYSGEPETTWVLFDYVTDETRNLGYNQRIDKLIEVLDKLGHPSNLAVIGSVIVKSKEEFLKYEEQVLNAGYEGIIIRDPSLPYKYGRCGKTFLGCWRVKRFIEEEILVTAIEEGESNHNEAVINERGRTERSSHAANKVPNGLVGNIKGPLLKDVCDPQSGAVLLSKGMEVTVSPGNMTLQMKQHYFKNQHELIGKIVKFKMFPKGILDKPRFPTFVTVKAESDCE